MTSGDLPEYLGYKNPPNIYLPLFISFFREKTILVYISGKSLAVVDKHAADTLARTCVQLSFHFIYSHLLFVWILAALAEGVGLGILS